MGYFRLVIFVLGNIFAGKYFRWVIFSGIIDAIEDPAAIIQYEEPFNYVSIETAQLSQVLNLYGIKSLCYHYDINHKCHVFID